MTLKVMGNEQQAENYAAYHIAYVAAVEAKLDGLREAYEFGEVLVEVPLDDPQHLLYVVDGRTERLEPQP